ncbi:unnamed protein product [Enterobius vermicularis]|uniref:VWFA domain-containing protein n=1 Tax=Enterobius vermicularis TaxID=51028 RepID=A0A0N4VQQ5_ENTVE|nr:unnamed protein product [Enterobius vermicularis]
MREASEVLLLLHESFRASRHIRGLWLFENLGKSLCVDKTKHEFDEGVELVGIIAKDGDPVSEGEQLRICTDTVPVFISKAYRLIFILDLSPSVFAVDVSSETLLHKRLLDNLERALIGVTMPVFFQGLLLDCNNVKEALRLIREKFENFSNNLCSFMQSSIGIYDRDRRLPYQNRNSNMAQKHGSEAHSKSTGMLNLLDKKLVGDFGYIKPEFTFCSMLRIGLLAARLLPENTQSNVILLTDANVGKPNEEAMQLLLNQLRNFTLSCSMKRNATAGLACGDLTNSELFNFLAFSTFGNYLVDTESFLDKDLPFGMNIYQKSLLSWSFQRKYIGNSFLEKFTETYNPEFANFCKRYYILLFF